LARKAEIKYFVLEGRVLLRNCWIIIELGQPVSSDVSDEHAAFFFKVIWFD